MSTDARYTATTQTADGTTHTGHGKTYPEAIRDAKKKAADHSRNITTKSGGAIYVRRD